MRVIELPGEDHPVRREFREWLAAHPDPGPKDLAYAGYVAPHWPRPWGRDADPLTQLIIEDELRRAGIQKPSNMIGIGWAGPTIIVAGTEAQKQRYLFPILTGEEIWCQLFSEPGAGSDLASLSTRAEDAGEYFVVNGQKIWTTYAHVAKFGILLARTDPDAPKHRGISYFICPMDAEGVTVTPIIDMVGNHSFNQVFLDNVKIPKENLVGELNKGWDIARVTLAKERVSLSSGGALWGMGPTAEDLIDTAIKAGGIPPGPMRDRVMRAYVTGTVLQMLSARHLNVLVAGGDPGPIASVKKAAGDRFGQELMDIAKDLSGAAGMVKDASAIAGLPALSKAFHAWGFGFEFSRALTIGGGTTEVQKNIIAERLLGLPKDQDPDAHVPWSHTWAAGKRTPLKA